MKRYAIYISIIFVLAGVFLMLGCAGTEPSRFYTLSTLSGEDMRQEPPAGELSVGIGPVEIPDYLDRPQIVTRSGLNELKVAEYDRWAGSLSENIAMAVRENLSFLLGTDRIFAYPWNSSSAIDYKLTIKIIRLDSIPGDYVALKAMWTVSSAQGNKEIVTRVTDYKEKLNASGYDAIVAATGKTFVNLSRDIAGEIRTIIRVK
ncbi:MAG: PqiC family protein [Nitrospirota bacterium]